MYYGFRLSGAFYQDVYLYLIEHISPYMIFEVVITKLNNTRESVVGIRIRNKVNGVTNHPFWRYFHRYQDSSCNWG